MADLRAALAAAEAQGCRPESLIVDPGIGFGKTAEQNLALLAGLAALATLEPGRAAGYEPQVDHREGPRHSR